MIIMTISFPHDGGNTADGAISIASVPTQVNHGDFHRLQEWKRRALNGAEKDTGEEEVIRYLITTESC